MKNLLTSLFVPAILILTINAFSDGKKTSWDVYEKLKNNNPYDTSFCIDNRLVGRWISEDDKDGDSIDDYGQEFTKTEYKNRTIYRYGKLWVLEFTGKGQWTILKNRLLIHCSWIKSKYEYDSNKIYGKKIEVDTFPEEIFSMKYQFENDSIVCMYWREYDDRLLSDFMEENGPSEITKKECFRKIKSKKE